MDSGLPATDTGPHIDTGTPPPRDTGTLPRDTGPLARDTGPRVDAGSCTVTCTSAAQCTSSCGAVPGGGIRCCDTSTSRCFVSHAAMCPAAGTDAGGMSY